MPTSSSQQIVVSSAFRLCIVQKSVLNGVWGCYFVNGSTTLIVRVFMDGLSYTD
jgi:hypothetical protein